MFDQYEKGLSQKEMASLLEDFVKSLRDDIIRTNIACLQNCSEEFKLGYLSCFKHITNNLKLKNKEIC